MSTQHPHTETDSRGYRRDNFWGDSDYDAELDDARGHPDQHPSGTSKHEYVAKSVLRQGATLLDPRLLTESPTEYDLYDEEDVGVAMVLSEPKHHVVADDGREGPSGYSHEKRVNEVLGTLVGGGTIQDRDVEGFMRCVDNYLWFLRQSGTGGDRLSVEAIEKLRSEAEWLKRHDDQNMHDTDIVAELSRAVDWPKGVINYFEEAQR